MADFKLGRIKFKWRGDWAVSTTAYLVDDIVKYGKCLCCYKQSYISINEYANFTIQKPQIIIYTQRVYFLKVIGHNYFL